MGASPVGVTLHSFSGELIIMGLSRNGVLKLWSPQVSNSTCICTCMSKNNVRVYCISTCTFCVHVL